MAWHTVFRAGLFVLQHPYVARIFSLYQDVGIVVGSMSVKEFALDGHLFCHG